MASADFSLRQGHTGPASPFQALGETSPGKNDDLPRTIAGSTPLPLGRRSFAISGPLAPVRSASYPIPVRQLTGSFHASFSANLTMDALRFPSVPATRFREDFHLQVIAHAGPTTSGRARPRHGVTAAALPHHRTYGSVSGGSRDALESPLLLKKAHESHLAQQSGRYGLVHVTRTRVPPRAVPIVRRLCGAFFTQAPLA